MRNRNIKINIYLNEFEKEIYDNKVKQSGLNHSEFFRKIILGYKLKEKPDERFYEFLVQLRGIAANINQMARIHNRAYGYVDEDKYARALDKVENFVDSLQDVYLNPKQKGVGSGNNKDMEIQK
ncbi:MAG: plasmid mobilization relaxosome protein MobC [Clostridia bacterium]|nr:plasmid mobilization relaxosome protein MobC [Clostridia bacterium]